eukprot:7165762-Prymnesium_polylepis.1
MVTRGVLEATVRAASLRRAAAWGASRAATALAPPPVAERPSRQRAQSQQCLPRERTRRATT